MSRELSSDEIKRINANFLNSVQSGETGQTKEAALFNQHIVLKLLR